MADLNARIKPKKSSTTGEVPQAADLEVAEIAVNTADGKLFVKHTDSSIKEISGGTDITTESIDALNDVDTTTATPADGQVLTWVNANSQWEPADAAGAVASVNGETGVVSLGIQDMNDYKKSAPVESYTLTGGNRGGADFSESDGWGAINTAFVYSKTGGQASFFASLGVGDEVSFRFDSIVDPLIMTVSATAAENAPNTSYILLTTAFPDVSSAVDVIVAGGDVPIALAEGDILKWSDLDQKFEPGNLDDYVSKADLKSISSASTSFADFQAGIAAL